MNSALSLAVIIKLPPDVLIPLVIGCVALFVLALGAGALADWKRKQPQVATRVGLVVAVVLAAVAVALVVRCLPNQSDPNNRHEDVTNLNLLDAPLAAFLAVLAVLFARFAGYPRGAIFGIVLAVALLAKPFLWPVSVTDTVMHGMSRDEVGTRQRGFGDPEHAEFAACGVVLLLISLGVARSRAA